MRRWDELRDGREVHRQRLNLGADFGAVLGDLGHGSFWARDSICLWRFDACKRNRKDWILLKKKLKSRSINFLVPEPDKFVDGEHEGPLEAGESEET